MLVKVSVRKKVHTIEETTNGIDRVVNSGSRGQDIAFAANVLKYLEKNGEEVSEGVFNL